MEGITKRDKQTVRFLKWINQYPGWWYLICTPNDEHINMDIMKTVIEHLEKEGFYEIIFVFLMVHRNESFIKRIFEYMLIEILTENWNGKVKSGEEIIKDILQYLS